VKLFNIQTCIFLVLFTSTVSSVNAQYDKDYGFTIGAASYLGEIGGKQDVAKPWLFDMKLNQARWTIGGMYRKKITGDFYARANLAWTRIVGADSLATNPERVGRNLSFRNDLIELSLRGEYVFLEDFDVGNTGSYETNLNMYLGAGIGAFFHNPKAKYEGDWYALQPLELEGVSYSRIQPQVPIYIGFSYTMNRSYRIGFETGYMFTFTDYLDDVSTTYTDTTVFTDIQKALQSRPYGEDINDNLPDPNNYQFPSPRGNPDDKDGYFFANFTVTKVIKNKYKTKRFNPHKRRYRYISSKRKKRRTKAKF